MSLPHPRDAFTIERRGGVTIFVASPQLEQIDFALHDEAAEILLAPLAGDDDPQVVVDLSDVNFFGSMFMAILLRCFKVVEERGGMMVLCGLSPRAKELLHLTSLDQVWPIYGTRREAIEALLAE